MKGLVIEINDQHTLILDENLSYSKIPTQPNVKVGMKVIFSEEKMRIPYRHFFAKVKWIPAIVCAVLLILWMFPQNAFKPEVYAVISFDINPSFELMIDKEQKVIDYKGFNGDSEKLGLQNVIKRPLNQAIEYIGIQLKGKGFVLDDSAVLITTTLTNKASKEQLVNAQMDEAIETSLHNVAGLDEVDIYFYNGNAEELKNADNNGLSLGKYKLAIMLENELSHSEVANYKIGELMILLDDENLAQFHITKKSNNEKGKEENINSAVDEEGKDQNPYNNGENDQNQNPDNDGINDQNKNNIGEKTIIEEDGIKEKSQDITEMDQTEKDANIDNNGNSNNGNKNGALNNKNDNKEIGNNGNDSSGSDSNGNDSSGNDSSGNDSNGNENSGNDNSDKNNNESDNNDQVNKSNKN